MSLLQRGILGGHHHVSLCTSTSTSLQLPRCTALTARPQCGPLRAKGSEDARHRSRQQANSTSKAHAEHDTAPWSGPLPVVRHGHPQMPRIGRALRPMSGCCPRNSGGIVIKVAPVARSLSDAQMPPVQFKKHRLIDRVDSSAGCSIRLRRDRIEDTDQLGTLVVDAEWAPGRGTGSSPSAPASLTTPSGIGMTSSVTSSAPSRPRGGT